MPKTIERQVGYREFITNVYPYKYSSTGKRWEFRLSRNHINILEMEDVLFHHNSAVMMPGKPINQKPNCDFEEDGTEDEKIKRMQDRANGLKALAIVFLQINENRNQRLIITGHTDTSGKCEDNYELSKMRALNVQYLIDGNCQEWAKNCRNRYKIEDYQQILQWINGIKICELFKISGSNKWMECDPGPIDNKWGSRTENAIKNYIQNICNDNKLIMKSNSIDQIIQNIKNDNFKWSMPMWISIYNLYEEYILYLLKIDKKNLEKIRDKIQWLREDFKIAACGESFPIDDADRDRYRSQLNRRVEILFFDQNDVTAGNFEQFKCEKDWTKPHAADKCPIWKKDLFFIPRYIDLSVLEKYNTVDIVLKMEESIVPSLQNDFEVSYYKDKWIAAIDVINDHYFWPPLKGKSNLHTNIKYEKDETETEVKIETEPVPTENIIRIIAKRTQTVKNIDLQDFNEDKRYGEDGHKEVILEYDSEHYPTEEHLIRVYVYVYKDDKVVRYLKIDKYGTPTTFNNFKVTCETVQIQPGLVRYDVLLNKNRDGIEWLFEDGDLIIEKGISLYD